MLKKKNISPAQVVALDFLGLILLGTVLLSLPISSAEGRFTGLLDAGFTAVSATCVTGLVVFNTATYWSMFGKTVILVLIQIGGLGVVTLGVTAAMLSGKKIGIKQRFTMQESISAPQMGGIVRMTGFILKSVALFEAVGAVLLSVRFVPIFGVWTGIWYAIFHSISAFCNAGFDLMGTSSPFCSLTGFANDVVVNLAVILLITIGGIGFTVWDDIKRNGFRARRWRLQTKLVLTVSAALVVVPAVLFYIHGFRDASFASLSVPERVMASAFQSVTMRTAGFNTVDLAAMGEVEQLMMIFLMLVGGSPGGTAGGFKTTSLVIFALCVSATVHGKDDLEAFGRRVPRSITRAAIALVTAYLALFLTGGCVIALSEDVTLMQALFEAASAVGTVGLTLGITPSLGALSKTTLMLLMYFGRLGGLTVMYALSARRAPSPSQYPEENVTIG